MELNQILATQDYTGKYISTSGEVYQKSALTSFIVKVSKILGFDYFERVAVAKAFKKAISSQPKEERSFLAIGKSGRTIENVSRIDIVKYERLERKLTPSTGSQAVNIAVSQVFASINKSH